ncbi:MAG: GIY-YIG nuclease family protein [Candidatus Bathyarchaeota archaeon]|nr:GIY-YIG nuclease family protein [Candidatus Bathyarchaeota archaeon]
MKTERSDVDHPLWRKKVDSSLFRQNGTTIPHWACKMWGIEDDFSTCNSKSMATSKIQVEFKGIVYDGWVTVAKEGERSKSPAYRLWYQRQLSHELKDAFLMSFARDIESRLRRLKGHQENVEDEIPFWEFIDIEYDRAIKRFYFNAYYVHKPAFSELFKRLIESPVLHKIDDELEQKPTLRIQKIKWYKRADLTAQIGANNVIYFLIDTKNKLLYIGEAMNLVDRLSKEYPSIPNWDYFRYNVLPDELFDHRVTLERMVIRDYASLLPNSVTETKEISDYRLVNDKIDN